ncbi:MAG TPA: hypothetical protein VKK19_05765 [Candidatus Dormibacteraeota bacterium]|nr:hypothetical protein [Candidatus Dormibacteraeota bacterium]
MTEQVIDQTETWSLALGASPAADRRLRLWGGLSGLAGAICLAVYFGTPALVGWPFSGVSGEELMRYATSHRFLFYAGAWLQVTGTLLSVVFFLTIVLEARATARLWGLVTIVASTAMLSVVLLEAAFLVAVPMAAAAGDTATARSMFQLSNGVFVRVFPLAPASATLIGLGLVLQSSRVLTRQFAYAALGLGIAFELAGILSTVSFIGFVATILLSLAQMLWVTAAGISFALSARGSVRSN